MNKDIELLLLQDTKNYGFNLYFNMNYIWKYAHC